MPSSDRNGRLRYSKSNGRKIKNFNSKKKEKKEIVKNLHENSDEQFKAVSFDTNNYQGVKNPISPQRDKVNGILTSLSQSDTREEAVYEKKVSDSSNLQSNEKGKDVGEEATSKRHIRTKGMKKAKRLPHKSRERNRSSASIKKNYLSFSKIEFEEGLKKLDLNKRKSVREKPRSKKLASYRNKNNKIRRNSQDLDLRNSHGNLKTKFNSKKKTRKKKCNKVNKSGAFDNRSSKIKNNNHECKPDYISIFFYSI